MIRSPDSYLIFHHQQLNFDQSSTFLRLTVVHSLWHRLTLLVRAVVRDPGYSKATTVGRLQALIWQNWCEFIVHVARIEMTTQAGGPVSVSICLTAPQRLRRLYVTYRSILRHSPHYLGKSSIYSPYFPQMVFRISYQYVTAQSPR